MAFASADLVFEVNKVGRVLFALGAIQHLTAAAELTNLEWTGLFADEEKELLEALLDELKPGERRGPVRVALKASSQHGAPRYAWLSMLWLRERGGPISCAISLNAAIQHPADQRPDGFVEHDAFALTVAELLERAGGEAPSLRLDLVELDGFGASTAAMGRPAADLARRRLAAALRLDSYGGVSEVAADKFALVRSANASTAELMQRLRRTVGGEFLPQIAELPMNVGTPAQNVKAIRYALERYIERGPSGTKADFTALIRRTTDEAATFTSRLKANAFQLAYQPVVDLQHRTLHHFEALARFDANVSPAHTIRLAEELDLIADFDLAVARRVTEELAACEMTTRIAVNISASSLMAPDFPESLLQVTSHDRGLRPRLLLEITETQQLVDLQRANALIAILRRAGHLVCLDDFGASAASLDYVRNLEVDVVKLDGRFVRKLETSKRDMTLVKHVVALCHELGISTIAEMVENAKIAQMVGDLGVDLGQGWFFGKPLSEPRQPPQPVAARRPTAVEQWG